MANLFPTAEPPSAEETEAAQDNVAFGSSWRFDYAAGEFLLTPTGSIAVSEGTDAWLAWCEKALRTERYYYLIYSRNYGQEYGGLIQMRLSRAGNESEIQRITTETLMADPRTDRVEDFTFAWEEDKCYFTCSVVNVLQETGTVDGSVVI